jgi:hypothetical protein
MSTLLEKTIFKVDVLTLEVYFGAETAARLETLARDNQLTRDLGDSIAMVGAHSQDAWARMGFVRNVSFGQFTDAIRQNAKHARDEGIILPETFDLIDESLPLWYGFLRERGVLKGDEMMYRIRGDTLRTVYRTVDGETPLDQIDVGPERRLSVLGGFFARKSDFRKGLLESLFVRQGS